MLIINWPHRAAVDNNFPGITGLGFFAADIVPIVAEYASFARIRVGQ
jgi:hypothetical protein